VGRNGKGDLFLDLSITTVNISELSSISGNEMLFS
jgi:hypothetical protein